MKFKVVIFIIAIVIAGLSSAIFGAILGSNV